MKKEDRLFDSRIHERPPSQTFYGKAGTSLRTISRRAHIVRKDPRIAYRFAYWALNRIVLRRSNITGNVYPYDVHVRVPMLDQIGLEIWLGLFETDVYNFMSRYLEHGMTFVDVGANIGLFTLVGATKAGPLGHVHAFEPSSREADSLRANVRLNHLNNVTINLTAVSDMVGMVDFSLCSDNYGVYNAIGSIRHPVAQKHVAQQIQVPSTTLDDYVHSQHIHAVHLVKVDVEGAELAVLRGAHDLLTQPNSPVLICEFSTEAAGEDQCASVWELGRSYGYRWFELNGEGELTQEVTAAPSFQYANLVATKHM